MECLADFEKFIQNDDTDTPNLVKSAMLHYQFETIHPFFSGNGRIGRIIVPLYLQSKGILDNAFFGISYYFEKNLDTYFNKLMKVRNNSDMISWIKFFLEAIVYTANKEIEDIKKLLALFEEIDRVKVDMPVKIETTNKVLDKLYESPITSRKRLLESTNVKPSTLNTTINALLEKSVIEEITGQGRNQIFLFKKYMNIFE